MKNTKSLQSEEPRQVFCDPSPRRIIVLSIQNEYVCTLLHSMCTVYMLLERRCGYSVQVPSDY